MSKKLALVFFLIFVSSTTAWSQATSDSYYQAGNTLYGQGNYDLCIKYYKAAIQVDPQNWKAYQALGSCEYRLGQTDNAIHDYNQSLTINPNNPSLQAFVNKISGGSAAPPAPSMAAAPTQPKRVLRTDALPKEGSIILNLMIAADIDSDDDFLNYYGSNLTTQGTPTGVEFGLGADYAIAPEFQIGLNFEGIYKTTQPVSITQFGNLNSANDTWSEFCLGPAADLKYLIPLDRKFSFVFRGELGYYTLIGTSLERDYYYDSSQDGAENFALSSSSVGGLIGVELEWKQSSWYVVDFGLGYRFLSFSPLTYTASGSNGTGTGTVPNSSNGNAFIDFSGFNFTMALRFF